MIHALGMMRRYGVVLVLAVAYAVFSLAAPSFFGVHNMLDILHVVSPMIIVAAGMALVVISGKLDISVGSTAYVASAIFALLAHDGIVPFAGAVAIAMGVGLALGLVNALIVVGLRINSLIATLGTMIAFRGLGLSLTDGGLIELPEPIKPFGNAMLGPVYVDTAIALAILLATHFLHRRTPFGRQLTAIGNSEDTSLVRVAETLLDDAAPLVRASAIWALSRLDHERFVAARARRLRDEPDEVVRVEWAA